MRGQLEYVGDMDTQAPNPSEDWQRVPVVSNYYDVPLVGVANFEGVPHFFRASEEILRKATDQEKEEWGQDTIREYVYDLYALEPDMLAKFIEKHELFERWHEAWMAKRVDHNQHPALPEDRARYDELSTQTQLWIDGLENIEPDKSVVGYFASGRETVGLGRSRWTSFHVQWSAVPETVQQV